MSAVFTPVDRASWSRRQAFWYYTEAAPTAYSVTCRLDVTNTRQALKEAGLRFFPAYVWLFPNRMGTVQFQNYPKPRPK